MPTYVVLYKFTPDGVKNIRDSVKRAGQTRQQNAAAGFKINEILWTQGPYDMVAIVEAPDEDTMMGAMLNVVSAGNVTSLTMRAFDAPAMSKIMATVPSLPKEDSVPVRPPSSNNPAASKSGSKSGARAKTAARRR